MPAAMISWLAAGLAIADGERMTQSDSTHTAIGAHETVDVVSAPTDTGPGSECGAVAAFVHKVQANRRAEYERWMAEVYMAALRKAALCSEPERLAMEGQHRLISSGMEADSSLTYVYLFDPFTPGTAGGFPELFRRAGYSGEQIQRLLQEVEPLISEATGYILVQRGFR